MTSHSKPTLFSYLEETKLLLEEAEEYLESPDGIPMFIQAKLSDVLIGTESKIDSTCNYLDHLEAKIELMKKQVKEAEEYIKKQEKRKQNLITYIQKSMQIHGVQKLLGTTNRWVSLRGFDKVIVNHYMIETLPKEYVRIKPAVIEPDKTKIKAALRAGEKIEGCTLVCEETVVWK